MSTTTNNPTEGQQQAQNKPASGGAATENDVHISQPHVERAEGPFEHSGETSGWTEEEKKENQEQHNS